MPLRNAITVLALACSTMSACDSGTSPTNGVTRITIQNPTPPPGATIQTSTTQFGGAFIDRGSGKLSIPITIDAGNDEAVARLFVYAKNADGVTCAQNLPDTPDFSPLKRGSVINYTVTGFQIFGALPCEAASFRVVLHRRADTHLNTEVTQAELIAESTLTARYSIR